MANIKQIITEENGSDIYTSTRLVYARNGRTVSYIIGETCDETDSKNPVYAFSYAREFRYDSARQRYLSAELSYSSGWSTVSETWSDYDGDSIYGDFSVTAGTVANLTSFEPGVGRVVDPLGTPSSMYYHTDMLGTTRLMTNSSAAATAAAVYTAFGEPVSGTNHRYGYAGAWGYQSHDIGQSGDAFPYQHVGHRYYNPAAGRFLQRDPIGISGGLNVYEYVSSCPTAYTDSLGLGHDGPGWFPGGRGISPGWGWDSPYPHIPLPQLPQPTPYRPASGITAEEGMHAFAKLHKYPTAALMCGTMYPAAVLADVVQAAFLLPLWGPGVRWFESTRQVHDAFGEFWRSH